MPDLFAAGPSHVRFLLYYCDRKTVCGEMALHIAFDRDMEGIYTTPLKALSNQKFAEFRQVFGASSVGLSTGDVSINRKDARVTVMTTEVYRNIAWRSNSPTSLIEAEAEESAQSPVTDRPWERRNSNDLRKNAVVVLDEFHYMGQPGRGGVWEECVITSPSHTQIVGLSATLPNALQLAEWIEGVTGRRTILVEAPCERPVPLKYLFATREGLYPLFRNEEAGPGSPLGLLGYRGDGRPASEKKSPKKKNRASGNAASDEDDDDDLSIDKLPKGLQVNPALSTLAQRRMQRVNRTFERQKERQKAKQQYGRGDDDWDLYSGRGIRPRSTSSREEKKEKERLLRREMRKSVPSLPVLLARLKEQDLLPAIFFIFSRAGCDQAADSIRSSFTGPIDPTMEVDFEDGFLGGSQPKKKKKWSRNKGKRDNEKLFQDKKGRSFRPGSNNVDEDIFNSLLDSRQAALDDEMDFVSGSPLSPENWKFYSIAGLLTNEQVKEVANRLARFNDENPEIAFPDNVLEQFLFGVGSHHAGMLPAHKAFVETLFRGNLMKACFATETLAAGINMPCRTTLVCALAKRDGGGGMSLLETSNLLQIAGRAGRRGMDTAGTCVLLATPFESHDIAASILTNPVKPITSQFRPSYSLAVNLISRGQGRLDVAKQLVDKSFASWERRRMEKEISSASEDEGVSDIIISVSEDKFMEILKQQFQKKIQMRTSQYDVAYVQHLVEVLSDREILKRASKGFESVSLSLELEKTTLGLLQAEMNTAFSSDLIEADQELLQFQAEDEASFREQIEKQQKRVDDASRKVKKHTFSSVANVANQIMDETSEEGTTLKNAFQKTRVLRTGEDSLSADNLAKFAKSSVRVKRKLRKLAKSNPGVDPESLLLQSEKLDEIQDSSWDDMIAITKVLVAYGCLVPERKIVDDDEFNDLEEQTLEITPAGRDVGMLSFENSLWCFSAMGGTFDVIGASSKFDEIKNAMNAFEADEYGLFDDSSSTGEKTAAVESLPVYLPQQEADELVSYLRFLSPGEMAGYVSCLVTGDTGRNSLSSIDIFQKLSTRQQRAIQVLLEATERLVDVQRQYSVDERTCNCQFDVTNSAVITAWADGCTWSEALEMSGAAPGDLTRIIGRAMDAVRQIGSLKFNPLRKDDLDSEVVANPFARGIHPEIRRLCREAAREMNRYPVKDPLPFEVEEEDIFEEDEEGEDDDVDAVEADQSSTVEDDEASS
jgi:superfamily II RNA helicase